MKCIYCNHNRLYTLKTKQLKCAKCNKKFSLKKIIQKENILNSFIQNFTINQTKNDLKLNYLTVKNQYDLIRKDITLFMQDNYQEDKVCAYEEYLYIQKSKQNKKENIFDAKSIISFEFDNKIFNLLMSNLSQYKEQFINDKAQEVYYKEFSKFLRFNKISKIKKEQTLIHRFWYFFENEILKYKGIKDDNFFYYLKEIEFKFNYSKKEQYDIISKL
jgi:transposase-like protein/DNA-directed RNA polymerase subunit RPC12/RpoP